VLQPVDGGGGVVISDELVGPPRQEVHVEHPGGDVSGHAHRLDPTHSRGREPVQDRADVEHVLLVLQHGIEDIEIDAEHGTRSGDGLDLLHQEVARQD